jgi:uncharacterized protein (UPF0262 family)
MSLALLRGVVRNVFFTMNATCQMFLQGVRPVTAIVVMTVQLARSAMHRESVKQILPVPT